MEKKTSKTIRPKAGKGRNRTLPQKRTAVTTPAVKRHKAAALRQESILGLHKLCVPKGAHKAKKLLGRGSGSGHGKTSTRGSKGQTSRSGRDFYPGFEGGQTPIIRRMPKRGFTNKFRKDYQIINLRELNRIKEATVTVDILKDKGLIRNAGVPVKILGDGELKNALTVQVHAVSKQARDKITKAGGKIELIHA
ncbi:MAG: 50S ribosomal protein L15 [Candidatus Omnitrophota bacterium]